MIVTLGISFALIALLFLSEMILVGKNDSLSGIMVVSCLAMSFALLMYALGSLLV